MKKFSFLALAAAGLLLVGCSSDRDVAEAEGTVIGGNGDSFVGISISMPSASGTTRANYDENNGEEDEFEVKGARLFLFKGPDEANAKFIKSFSMTEGTFENDDKGKNESPESTTHITSTATAVFKIENLKLLESEQLWAYVAVNPSNSLGSDLAAETLFKDFSKTVFKSEMPGEEIGNNYLGGNRKGTIASTGLLMTNSPVSSKSGGSSAPDNEELSTLVKIEKNSIKNTKEDAAKAPAGCIYVERAAAKVTVEKGSHLGTTMTIANSTGTDYAMPFEIVGWQVINTEPGFYNTRQIKAEWDPWYSDLYGDSHNNSYRFVSLNKFDPKKPAAAQGQTVTHNTRYRTYFAEDPQYSIEATARTDNNIKLQYNTATDGNGDWLSLDGRAFVTENTFDVERQERQNTTQVTVKVKFNEGKNVYTLTNDAKYYTDETVDNAVAAAVEILDKISTFKTNAVKKANEGASTSDGSKSYESKVSVAASVTKTTASESATYELTYKIEQRSKTGDGEWSSYTDVTDTYKTDLASDWTEAVNSAKGDIKVKLYLNGVSYYNVRIQHFGTEETPWSATGSYVTQPGTTIDQIYGSSNTDNLRDKRFLGRYGVVRDNWYKLTVDGISKFGSAVPKSVYDDTTPDDEIEKEYYISAHVHILPWVLRNQTITF